MPRSPLAVFWRMVGFTFCFGVWEKPLIAGEASDGGEYQKKPWDKGWGARFPNRTRTAGSGPNSHHPKCQESGKSSMWSCMWWIWKDSAWFSSSSYIVLCGGSTAWPCWSPINLIKIRVAFSTLCKSLHTSIWKLLGSLLQCSHPLVSSLSLFFHSSCILITFNHLCPYPSYP